MTKLNGEDTSLSDFDIVELPDGVGMSIGNQHAEFDPDAAMHVAEVIMRYAYHVKTGKELSGQQALSQQIREKTENRMAIVLTNLLEKKKKPTYIARELFTIAMREVL